MSFPKASWANAARMNLMLSGPTNLSPFPVPLPRALARSQIGTMNRLLYLPAGRTFPQRTETRRPVQRESIFSSSMYKAEIPVRTEPTIMYPVLFLVGSGDNTPFFGCQFHKCAMKKPHNTSMILHLRPASTQWLQALIWYHSMSASGYCTVEHGLEPSTT